MEGKKANSATPKSGPMTTISYLQFVMGKSIRRCRTFSWWFTCWDQQFRGAYWQGKIYLKSFETLMFSRSTISGYYFFFCRAPSSHSKISKVPKFTRQSYSSSGCSQSSSWWLEPSLFWDRTGNSKVWLQLTATPSSTPNSSVRSSRT